MSTIGGTLVDVCSKCSTRVMRAMRVMMSRIRAPASRALSMRGSSRSRPSIVRYPRITARVLADEGAPRLVTEEPGHRIVTVHDRSILPGPQHAGQVALEEKTVSLAGGLGLFLLVLRFPEQPLGAEEHRHLSPDLLQRL